MTAPFPPHGSSNWDGPLKTYIDDALSSKRGKTETVPVADLATTGTASATTFLRGDGAWVAISGVVTPPTGGDTTPPSVPANIRAAEVRSTSARIAWDAATDDVAVTGYEITVNGAVQAGPVTTLYVELPDLTPSTSYTITVRARDAAGNWSANSTALHITTLAAPSLGYPDASNSPYLDSTGVLHYFPNFPTDGTEATQTLTPASGVIYSTADNQIIEGLNVDGGVIIIRHNNVTVRRCYFKANTTYWTAISTQTGNSADTSTNYAPIIEDCCFNGNDVPGSTGITGIGLTVRRCNIYRWDNGAQGEDKQTWEDNFFHDGLTFLAEAHTDMIQFDFGDSWPVRDWTCRHNTLLSRTVDNQGTTSCIITNQDPLSGHLANILIDDNVFAGGAYAVYGPQRDMTTDFILRNNKFWTLYYPTVGAYGELANSVTLMHASGNSVGAFGGGLVSNVIQGSWIHDHYIGPADDSTPDSTPPSVPSGLASADITTTGFTVTWSAATDNVGVTGYEVFLGGVSQGVVSVTSKTFTGLSSSTTYSVTVRARDAAGNWSSQSSALSVSTLAASSYSIKSVSISSTTPSTGTQTVVTGEDVATAVGDFVLLFQFSDYRLKANTGLPVANGSITATEIAFPGVDNANKFRASYFFATASGAQTITAVSTPGDDDKRIVAIVISGVNTTTPIDVFASVDAGASIAGTGGSNAYESPAVTTTGASELIVSAVSLSVNRALASVEDGYTLLKTESGVGGFFSYSIAYAPKATAGDTGAIDHFYTSSGTNITGLTVALKPA